MSNVVSLHGDKRWKAVLVYDHQNGPITIEHFLEEISELHNVIEHGPDWNTLITCTGRTAARSRTARKKRRAMNIGEIAERFIRAAEIERASHEHVGPAGPAAALCSHIHR
ncbi:hypothetical protein [Mesorhizobium sp.]|uniref:hypothetical protein n=1 Tax=Mesorhizobium sp. TaxID=1871066 RepID=UPI000FEA45E1|nr:hypothetical protein [Mesorhizobium sp.]RWP35038.1 MAG: hypothetical protein EOR04_31570 [Mesorhizobium sp.]RWP60712.1 MAG: hypothetical protein EOR08_20180 [Mesorhizobium sp.]